MSSAASARGAVAQPPNTRRKRGVRFWLRRIILLCVVFLIGLLTVGAVYQAIATALDKRTHPAPGQLVDIGGYQLHIHCVGQGNPTVILESAADMMSADWGWVQPEIAKQTRVCAYDRAGMGWSDTGPRPRDAQHVTHELHALLKKANIPGPYVLVGHSAGGLYVRLYAATYPTDVAGLVLIDPGHPDMLRRIPALQANMASEARLVSTMQVLSYFGGTRLLGIGMTNAQGLPAEQAAESSAAYVTPEHWATLRALINATPQSYEQVRPLGTLGNRPLSVISASSAWLHPNEPADHIRNQVNTLHAELATLSTTSHHRVVDGATHGSLLHNQQHAQETSKAILEVVAVVQEHHPLHP